MLANSKTASATDRALFSMPEERYYNEALGEIMLSFKPAISQIRLSPLKDLLRPFPHGLVLDRQQAFASLENLAHSKFLCA
jgi:hypothetical protein